MRRHPALAALSRDHHTALVLAKRIAAAGSDFVPVVVAAFAAELEPHFRIEEATLLPRLEGAPSPELRALARRAREDHAELRAQASALGQGECSELQAFGRLLEAHVRFEERELFPAVERGVDASTLAEIAAASDPC